MTEQVLYRVIDANLNRAKEGLRVCEDLCRFVIEDIVQTKALKKVRHQLTACILALPMADLIQARDIVGDIGKGTLPSEAARVNISDIFYANAQRAKESLRVLEECTKVLKIDVSQSLKELRYQVYDIEKTIITQL